MVSRFCAISGRTSGPHEAGSTTHKDKSVLQGAGVSLLLGQVWGLWLRATDLTVEVFGSISEVQARSQILFPDLLPSC